MIRTELLNGEFYGSTLGITKDAPWGSRSDPKLLLSIQTDDGEQSIYLDAEAELQLLKFLLER